MLGVCILGRTLWAFGEKQGQTLWAFEANKKRTRLNAVNVGTLRAGGICSFLDVADVGTLLTFGLGRLLDRRNSCKLLIVA